MSIRIYIGNLPQEFNPKEFDSIIKSVSDSIRFKAVLDKETKECRGFGFATTNNEENASLLIQKLNGFEFNGSKLRVELSEKKDSASNKKNSGSFNKNKKRKDFKKIVHSDAPNLQAPDPRWAGELSKLKDLLANQKTPA
ncbi:RNA-binding protein [Prochlorococcus marinus XMU1419]|uniref:RNA-binding protein n=1 Tax=Prochlorococcus marinus TaxID=1219 RepID=UPI001ADA3A87|nr:RNA-binding protein [Prochlorococcus marinus]MBO8233044.1 RNA-binding protein [Prochlorococcus marinus XMU1419]MBW3076530.1 RNA-binding protein [Prochlorococcus marinus str. XMU1419]